MTAPWTRSELDDQVAKWNRDLQLANTNILELMDDFHYKTLAGDGGLALAPLTGQTERVVTPVVKALDELWQLLPGLTKLLDEVNLRHAKLGWFRNAADIAELQDLLEGESVTFTTKTTYAQRSLLTPDEVTRAMSPQRILRAMIEAYDQAKAVVVSVGDVVRRIATRLDDAAHEHAELKALAESLGDPAPELAALDGAIAELRTRLGSDPLAVDGDVEPSLAVLEPLRRRLEDAKRDQHQLGDELLTASAALDSLRAELSRAATAHADCCAKIAVDGDAQAPFPPSVVDELASWLHRLEGTFKAGRRSAVRVGFSNWQTQVAARRAECDRIARDSQRLLDRRRELRGLLDGLRAKAVNIGLAEDPAVADLYGRAHALLYSRPTPMDAAEKLVSAYLQAVR